MSESQILCQFTFANGAKSEGSNSISGTDGISKAFGASDRSKGTAVDGGYRG